MDIDDSENELTKQIYFGSKFNVQEVVHMLSGLMFKHKFSWEAINHILELIKVLLPSPSLLPKTILF